MESTEISSYESVPRFSTNRRAFDQGVFNEAFHAISTKEPHAGKEFLSAVKSRGTLKTINKVLRTLFPVIDWARKYDVRHYLLTDLIVGLTIAIFQVPQGMAYGQLADVRPVDGLYTSFFPVLIYAFMGTSRHLSVGTFAVAALMVGGIVVKHSNPCPSNTNCTSFSAESTHSNATPHDVVLILCFLSGLYQFLFGLFRLGGVSVFLSPQLVSGFTTAAAFHVLTSQWKYIFGLELERFSGVFNLVYTYMALFKSITFCNIVTLELSVSTIIFLLVVKELLEPRVKKKLKFPLPVELLVLTIGLLVSNYCKLNQEHNVAVTADIPTGLPAPVIPNFQLVPDIAYDALPLAVISFASSVSIAKIYADKNNYVIDSNQELIALGTANIFGTFFSCIPATASLSRSSVQNETGGKTQVVSIVSCVAILIILLFLAPVLHGLPNCILAAITIVSLKGLVRQVCEFKYYWKISAVDGMIWIITFVSVVVLSIDVGLAVGVAFSLLTLIWRSQRPKTCLLGEVGNTNVYVPIKKYLAAKEIENVKIFYFGGPLHFANAEYFINAIERRTGLNVRKLKAMKQKNESQLQQNESRISLISTNSGTETAVETNLEDPLPTHIILDCSGFSYIDTPGVIALKKVIEEFKTIDITVFVAAFPASIYGVLKRGNFFNALSQTVVYPTVHDAVLHTTLRCQDRGSICILPEM